MDLWGIPLTSLLFSCANMEAFKPDVQITMQELRLEFMSRNLEDAGSVRVCTGRFLHIGFGGSPLARSPTSRHGGM